MRYFLFAACFSLMFVAHGQECALGVATVSSKTLIDVFQLRDGQLVSLKKIQNDAAEAMKQAQEEIKKLFEEAPQDTPTQLKALNTKHEAFLVEMEAISLSYDTAFLKELNPKQYQRYVTLCTEAKRTPIVLPEAH